MTLYIIKSITFDKELHKKPITNLCIRFNKTCYSIDYMEFFDVIAVTQIGKFYVNGITL